MWEPPPGPASLSTTTPDHTKGPVVTTQPQQFNVVAELDASFDEDTAEALLDPIADYSGAASRSELGHAEVVFTIPRRHRPPGHQHRPGHP